MNVDEDIRIETNNGIETHIFDPYNELNVLITNDEIHSILNKYGLNVPIFNYELYKRALFIGLILNVLNWKMNLIILLLHLNPKMP